MSPLKKLVAPVLLLVTIVPMPSVMALTLQQVVNSIQTIDPNLPTGVANPKGSIGSLIAELFYWTGDGSKNGKIKPQYIDYSGISAWTQSGSDAFYSGTGNIGIGTTSPSDLLTLSGASGPIIGLNGPTANYRGLKMSDSSGAEKWFAGANSLGNYVIRQNAAADLMTFSGGNVGIGTTSPGAKLDVAGTVYVDGDYAGSNRVVFRNTDTTTYSGKHQWEIYPLGGPDAGLDFYDRTIWWVPLHLGENGYVGIGTTSPAANLDIVGSSALARIVGTPGTNGTLQLASKDVYSHFLRSSTDGSFSISQDLVERFRINSAGNVGIGTSSPGAKLEIASDGTAFTYPTPGTSKGSLHISPVVGTNSNTTSITFGANSNGTVSNLGQAGMYVQSSATYGTKMYFGTTNNYGVGSQSRMMIDHLGNVGIGTTSPQGKLDVRGAVVIATPDYAVGSVGSVFALTMGAASGNTYATLDSYVGGGTAFGNIVLHPTGNGNVGIGTPSPSTKLDVLGTIRNSVPSQGYIELSGDLPGYGTNVYPTLKTNGSALYFSVWGAYSAWMSAGWVLTAISDKNKKENFRDLDYGEILGKIDVMPLKEWNYKMEDRSIRHIGPFAQDFHALFGLNGPDDKMISNMDPTGVALAGIKGLSERDKVQEARLNDLQKQNQELKSLVCLDHPGAEVCK